MTLAELLLDASVVEAGGYPDLAQGLRAASRSTPMEVFELDCRARKKEPKGRLTLAGPHDAVAEIGRRGLIYRRVVLIEICDEERADR